MRAPLGMKTTNAKSRAFGTPAPLSSAGRTQKVSPRLRRPKVKVHQPELAQESEDDVPEIEYMPPKDIPLEGDMDDYNIGTIPKISDQDMVCGIWQAYHNPIEDDGRTREQRKFEEEIQQGRKQRNEEMEKVFAAQMAKDEAETREYYGIKQPKREAPKPTLKKTTTGPSTIRARSAAAALSPPLKPSYAAPTTAAKSRVPTGLVSGRKGAKTPTEPTASRQASSSAVTSKSTIGYAAGRAGRTASAARKPLSNVTKPPPFSVSTRPATASSLHNRSASTNTGTIGRSRGPMSRCSSTSTNATLVAPQQEEEHHRTPEDAERQLELELLMRADDEDDEAWMNSFSNQLHGDPFEEEHDDFQFQLPEGF
jgi:hypothetical protein